MLQAWSKIKIIPMKLLLISLIVLLTYNEPPKTDSFKPIVVLELFTSQGCSSCPPADDLLNKVKKVEGTSNVIALSYHVDYWNYIGWKDPFSKSEYSDKQRKYGQKFNSSSVYTPQVVVNGKEHFVGSNESTLNSKIKSYSGKNSDNTVKISNISKDTNNITFDYKIEGNVTNKQLRVVLVIDERTTSVSKGENKNRSLKNSNIVVSQLELDLNSNTGKGSISIPSLVTSSDHLSLVSIIVTFNYDIVGASHLKL